MNLSKADVVLEFQQNAILIRHNSIKDRNEVSVILHDNVHFGTDTIELNGKIIQTHGEEDIRGWFERILVLVLVVVPMAFAETRVTILVSMVLLTLEVIVMAMISTSGIIQSTMIIRPEGVGDESCFVFTKEQSHVGRLVKTGRMEAFFRSHINPRCMILGESLRESNILIIIIAGNIASSGLVRVIRVGTFVNDIVMLESIGRVRKIVNRRNLGDVLGTRVQSR
jgi:hypothetical protein